MVLRPQVLLRFGLWYALNVAFTNKLALEHVRIFVEGASAVDDVVKHGSASSLSLPYKIGSVQFGVGALYSIILWVSGCRRPVPHAAEILSAISSCIERAHDFSRITTRIGWVVDHRNFSPGRRQRHHSSDYSPLATKAHNGNDHQNANDIEHDDTTENLHHAKLLHLMYHQTLNFATLFTLHFITHSGNSAQ
jgi:hypothetical protein